MRKICAITGYRSDYAKLKSVLKAINANPKLSLEIIALGFHSSQSHGSSIDEIEADGFNVKYRFPTSAHGDSPLDMSKSIGITISDLCIALAEIKPDVTLIVGDRYEIMAAAITSSIANIPVAHIQGGELSGTIDETIRHSITKLSHIHFPSTELSKQRIILLGENPKFVFNVGCPAIDRILNQDYMPRKEMNQDPILRRYLIDLDFDEDYFILIQHPVTTEYGNSYKQFYESVKAVNEIGIPTLILYPNPDAGSQGILKALRSFKSKSRGNMLCIEEAKHIPFPLYLNLLKNCRCLIGNSSSGIREAHCFNVPVINIGTRQLNRERTPNIIDVPHDSGAIELELSRILQPSYKTLMGSGKIDTYGDGTAGERISKILTNVDLKGSLNKQLFRHENK